MGRPRQPVGTYDRIYSVDQPSGEVQARTRFRDYDGRVRMVTKVGRSRASAERALKAELSNRQAVGGGAAVAAATRMTVLAVAVERSATGPCPPKGRFNPACWGRV
jgi:hypothetical protein